MLNIEIVLSQKSRLVHLSHKYTYLLPRKKNAIPSLQR
tara:strand:- start:354 stop:467 length:114 start_codon:yes stop_codon:yes gene_type:complete